MGLKEYLQQKKLRETAPKYRINNIECAYTADGSFVAPFVINREETKIKDIASNKIVELEKQGFDYETIKNALSNMYQIPQEKIKFDSLFFMINDYTYGTKIPGRIFKKVRNEILKKTEDRDVILTYGRINKLAVNSYDLEPLINLISVNLNNEYKRMLERENRESNERDNLDF